MCKILASDSFATDTLGKVPIISEDGDRADPDDTAHGVDLTFAIDSATSAQNTTFPGNEEGAQAAFIDADEHEIRHVSPCFTPGTRIATVMGERRVEDLKVGDQVITRDNGIQDIRWVGARHLSSAELARNPHLNPIRIRQGALGAGLPERDMHVSPQHRVLLANEKTALFFDESEVLVAAKHLTGMDGIDVIKARDTTYIHIMFAYHEVILSDGTWTESFQPDDQTLAAMGAEQSAEIIELFPELETVAGIEAYTAARRSLKKHEAQMLLG